MKDIVIMENFRTPDFPYKVIWMFPDELRKEKIFQNNLSHTLNYLKELIEEESLLKGNERVLECLKFDLQKEKQIELIKENWRRISEINEKMNADISPYHWSISKDVNYYLDKKFIKADYLLALH